MPQNQLTKDEAGVATSELKRTFRGNMSGAASLLASGASSLAASLDVRRKNSSDDGSGADKGENSTVHGSCGALPVTRSLPPLTKLCNACMRGEEETVVELLESFVGDPHAGGVDGGTALMRAAGSGHIELTALLIGSGARVHAMDDDGLTALAHASLGGHKRTCAVLLRAGGSLLHCFTNGLGYHGAPLMRAAADLDEEQLSLSLANATSSTATATCLLACVRSTQVTSLTASSPPSSPRSPPHADLIPSPPCALLLHPAGHAPLSAAPLRRPLRGG